MKLKDAVALYKVLGEAKVSTLSEKDITIVVKTRKDLRSVVEDYEAFLKDCQEKFKPEDWDNIQEKIQKWQQEGEKTTLTVEERIKINKAVADYQNKINSAVKDELNKDVEITIEKLSDDAAAKLLKHNDWEINKLDELSPIL